MMFLDVSKKPGDPDAVKTADEIVAENNYLRDLVQRLAQRLQMARLEGFGGPEREKLLDEAREAVGESIEAAAKREMAKGMSKKLDGNRSIPGNAAEMRHALEDTEELLEHFAKPGTMLHSAFFLHMRDNRAALAKPPRNCDSYDVEDGVTACMQAIDAAWHEIDTIRATIGWMLAALDERLRKEAKDGK